jgi:hypothetical protein
MGEKRSLERFDLVLPSLIKFMDQHHEERILHLQTSNICSGGAYFSTNQPLPEGTQVNIDLVLPLDRLKILKKQHQKAFIKATGTVLRTESEGMAVCFDNYDITG